MIIRTITSRFTSLVPAEYGQLIITNSLLCPWGKKTPITETNIFSNFNPLNTGAFYGPLSVRINGVCSIADVMI